eukprot:GHRR01026064.1.p2 GENE.GHRR01026064.1~~GHRR01026064.1.p2  ORF type:complete len:113 (+),score=12.25 GHRR01026064.1:705-1043(+)
MQQHKEGVVTALWPIQWLTPATLCRTHVVCCCSSRSGLAEEPASDQPYQHMWLTALLGMYMVDRSPQFRVPSSMASCCRTTLLYRPILVGTLHIVVFLYTGPSLFMLWMYLS